MNHPYDSSGNGGRYVPAQAARQLLSQRDQLLGELQKVRRLNDELEAALQSTRVQLDTWKRRALSAEEAADEVRDELERVASARGSQLAASSEERVDHDAELIDRLKRRVASLSNDLQRVQQRTGDTVAAARREERVRLLSGLGDVLDSVERALHLTDDGPWLQGLEAIRDQVYAYMRAEGAVVMGAVGEQLDPRRHEAIGVIDAPDFEKGEIVQVDRHGIELDDGTVARAARVLVAG